MLFLLYDNITGTGRPLAVVFAENEGIDTSVMASCKVLQRQRRFQKRKMGTVIPNIFSNGVRRFNVHRLTNGFVANFQTDADGYGQGRKYSKPQRRILNPLRISLSDAPLIIKRK
ncbi:MAG: hypothetical protein IPI04_18565 [Ignavibacteria bacterium]|nr:hypothetical protein [Ignavibacteria bacterium]